MDTAPETETRKPHRISVHGCDDTTIFDMALSDHEVAFLARLCETCNATSEYACMPTMQFEPLPIVDGGAVDIAPAD